jgi:hypothetical protein
VKHDLNNDRVNQAALHWLQEVKAVNPYYLHVLNLASWGLERGVEGEWPDRDRPAVEEQLSLLFGWKPANVMAWLVSNPNGRREQQDNLVWLLEDARQHASERRAVARRVLLLLSPRRSSARTAGPITSRSRRSASA